MGQQPRDGGEGGGGGCTGVQERRGGVLVQVRWRSRQKAAGTHHNVVREHLQQFFREYVVALFSGKHMPPFVYGRGWVASIAYVPVL